MAYSPSPRPTFAGPTHILYATVTRHLWGDQTSGEVADWIYVSSDQVHQLVFGLPPGGAFRHSEDYRTIFGADEVYYVLSGAMIIANPQSGEVHPVRAGEAVFFGPDNWHHVFNDSGEQLRVLEFFAPPPSRGTSGAYARTKPALTSPVYRQEQWIGRWPAALDAARAGHTMRVMRDSDLLWQLEGAQQQTLVGLIAATEHLTVGKLRLLPGRHSDVQRHGGDEGLYLTQGTLHVRLPEHDGQRWFEIRPGDGFYLPQGTPHQYYNMSDAPAEMIFGVAPAYDMPPAQGAEGE